MDENKRLLKNTGIIAIGNISTRLVSFLLLPLYTLLLSSEEYGDFDYLLTIATFCMPIVSLLMDESIFRFLLDCKNENDRKSVISTSFIIVIIGMTIFTVFSIPIMLFLKYEYIYYAIIYILLTVFSSMISSLLRGIGRTDWYAVFNFLIGFFQILFNVLFIAALKWGIVGMILAPILAQLLVSLIFAFNIKLWKYIHLFMWNNKLAKNMIIYSLPLIPNKISWTIINLSDRIIIMNVLGGSSAGLYAVSNKFPNLIDTVYGFFYQAWKESSARVLGELSQENFYNSVYNYLKNFMYSIVLVIIAFMPIIFKVLVNESFCEAIYYIPCLIIATYFANISGFYGGIFTAYKDTKTMGITTIIAALINLLTNICLIRLLGLYAAALSTLLANFIIYLYRKMKLKKYIHLKEDWKNRGLSIIITCIILVMFYQENMMSTVTSCVVAIIFFFVINYKCLLFLYRTICLK